MMRGIVVCAVLLVVLLGFTDAQNMRMEKYYDYDGMGEAYFLRGRWNDTAPWMYVCADDYWYEFSAREKDCSQWCRQFDMTFGSPFTGGDQEPLAELTLRVDCPDKTESPDDCDVREWTVAPCEYHVLIQCMDPISEFEKAQPLSGILVGIIAALCVILIISWIGCCCVGTQKNKSDKGQVNPQQTTTTQQVQMYPQQPQPQQQYPPQQQPQGVMYIQQPPAQAPGPQAMYPPPQSSYGAPPSAPPTSGAPPPPYNDIQKM